MKKKVMVILSALILVTAGGWGAWYYFQSSGKGEATEAAAQAMADAARAYQEWVRDKEPHTLIIGAMVMGGTSSSARKSYPIEVRLKLEGQENLERVCRMLPRLRDTINMTFTGRVAGRKNLSEFDERLNRAFGNDFGKDVVKQVRVLPSSRAFAPINGCT